MRLQLVLTGFGECPLRLSKASDPDGCKAGSGIVGLVQFRLRDEMNPS